MNGFERAHNQSGWYAGYFYYFIHIDKHAAHNNQTEKSIHIGQEFIRRNTQRSPLPSHLLPFPAPLLSPIPGHNRRKKKSITQTFSTQHLYEFARKSSHHHSHYDHRMQNFCCCFSGWHRFSTACVLHTYLWTLLWNDNNVSIERSSQRQEIKCLITTASLQLVSTLCEISNKSGECESTEFCVFIRKKKN